MVTEMNISAQCIRVHGNRVLNFNDLSEYIQELKKCICGPIQLEIKRQNEWLSSPSNLVCLEGLCTILKNKWMIVAICS